MSPQDALHDCAGWFGKIPTLGDFVRRNLPERFVETWDAWLSEELWQAQLLLSGDWSQTWRRAPMWYFGLGAEVVDERGWQGVLVPSVDRVGREFPLTIALSQGRRTAARGAQWWGALGELARRAVGPDGDSRRRHEQLVACRGQRAGRGNGARTRRAAARGVFPAAASAVECWVAVEQIARPRDMMERRFLLAAYHFNNSFLVCGETLTRRTHVGWFNVPREDSSSSRRGEFLLLASKMFVSFLACRRW